MSITKRVQAALKVAKATWSFALMKSGADELGVEDNRFESGEWQDVETALDDLEPLTLQDHQQVFAAMQEHVRMGQQVFDDYCYLLECEMATLEFIRGIKRTPKREIERHESIIKKNLVHVRVYVSKGFTVKREHGRVYEAVHEG